MRKYNSKLVLTAMLVLMPLGFWSAVLADRTVWPRHLSRKPPVDYLELAVDSVTDSGGFKLMGRKRGKILEYETVRPTDSCVVEVNSVNPSVTRYYERTGCTVTKDGEDLVVKDGDSFARLAVNGFGNKVYAVARDKSGKIIWERWGAEFSHDEGFGTISCRATVNLADLLTTVWNGKCWILTGPELERGIFFIDASGSQMHIDVVAR